MIIQGAQVNSGADVPGPEVIGSMDPLCHLLTNGVVVGVKSPTYLILTFDPNFLGLPSISGRGNASFFIMVSFQLDDFQLSFIWGKLLG